MCFLNFVRIMVVSAQLSGQWHHGAADKLLATWPSSKILENLEQIFGRPLDIKSGIFCIVDCGKRSKTNKRPGPDDWWWKISLQIMIVAKAIMHRQTNFHFQCIQSLLSHGNQGWVPFPKEDTCSAKFHFSFSSKCKRVGLLSWRGEDLLFSSTSGISSGL